VEGAYHSVCWWPARQARLMCPPGVNFRAGLWWTDDARGMPRTFRIVSPANTLRSAPPFMAGEPVGQSN